MLQVVTRIATAAALALMPWLVRAQELTNLENPLAPNLGGALDPNELFSRVAGGFIFAIGAATLFFTVLGGYIVLTAAGNSERYERGKKVIAYAIIGLVVTTGSYVLLSVAINVATGGQGIPEFEKFRLTDPLKITGPDDLYGGRLAKFFVSGLGALTVLMLVWGGLQWTLAAGSEEKIKKARQTLGYAFMGVVLVLGSYIFINFIYTPIYRLFTSGTNPAAAPPPAADPTDTKKVVCFRREVGNTFGATCSLETVGECFKPRDNLQRGEANATLTSCGDVGACVQVTPGVGVKNRVAAADCVSGSTTSMKMFKAFSWAFGDGTCPFDGTTAIDLGDGEHPSLWCFADVTFIPGTDSPLNGDAACLRELVDGSGRLTGEHDCIEVTAFQCSRSNDDTHAGATFYPGRLCGQLGSCEMDFPGSYACKNGVVREQCKEGLFPPIGRPIPPWGCTPYDEISGNCYVPLRADAFKNYAPGNECPRR